MPAVDSMSAAERVGEAMRRSLPRLGPAARAEVEKLLTPEALVTVAGVLVVWVGSHFVGVGEIVDIIVLAVGVTMIGIAVFDGVEELLSFATLALRAQSEADLDQSAEHFARAISILGVQAVLAVLRRGAPRSFRGGRARVGTAPSFARGPRIRPPLRSTRTLPAGHGATTAWGEIVISRLGTSADRRLAALHESVHRLLTPKLEVLRNFRISGRAASYSRSALSKYLEEALAETVAQVGVNGLRAVFKGISFPVSNGYVTILRQAMISQDLVFPVLPELAGLLAGGFMLGGEAYEIRVAPRRPAVQQLP